MNKPAISQADFQRLIRLGRKIRESKDWPQLICRDRRISTARMFVVSVRYLMASGSQPFTPDVLRFEVVIGATAVVLQYLGLGGCVTQHTPWRETAQLPKFLSFAPRRFIIELVRVYLRARGTAGVELLDLVSPHLQPSPHVDLLTELLQHVEESGVRSPVGKYLLEHSELVFDQFETLVGEEERGVAQDGFDRIFNPMPVSWFRRCFDSLTQPQQDCGIGLMARHLAAQDKASKGELTWFVRTCGKRAIVAMHEHTMRLEHRMQRAQALVHQALEVRRD